MPVQTISRACQNHIFSLSANSRSNDLMDIALMRLVMALVCQIFSLKEGYILGSSRGPSRLVLARHMLQYLSHIVFGLNYTDVARMTCRDRTSVAHACGRIEDERDDRDFDKAVFFLELSLMYMARQITERAL